MSEHERDSVSADQTDISDVEPGWDHVAGSSDEDATFEDQSASAVDEWPDDGEGGEPWYDTWEQAYADRIRDIRLEDLEQRTHQMRGWAMEVASRTLRASRVPHIFQIFVAVLMFVGSAVALGRVLLFATGGDFLERATSAFDLYDTPPTVPSWGLVLAYLAPVVLTTLLGLALLYIAISLIRYRAVHRAVAGISQLQQEMAAGMGITRPLVQVVQETVTMARRTFSVVLRLNQATFWVGLAFMAIALFRILAMGDRELLSTSVAGAGGLLTWLFSRFLARDKDIQANLGNVTQLELGLVGLAKQTMPLDNWLTSLVENPEGLPEPTVAKVQKHLEWAFDRVQESTYSTMGLVQVYTETLAEEPGPAQELLYDAVRAHTGLSGTGPVSVSETELATIAGKYATVLVKTEKLATIEDLWKAGSSPQSRKKLSGTTGIREELIVEFVRLADLMRVESITAEIARLLRDAGIGGVADLAAAKPSDLHSTLEDINAKQGLISALPSQDAVATWVSQAKELPEEITY